MTADIINLKKEEIDKLEETLDSLREYGFAHVEVGGELLTFSCDQLIKNREDYQKHLKDLGLKDEEIAKFLDKI